jgi:hypothetical protein
MTIELAVKTVLSPVRAAQDLASGLQKLGAAIWSGRIPGAIGQRLAKDPQRSWFWKILNWLCPTPRRCFEIVGFFPLPLKQVSYQSFEHREHDRVQEFPLDEVPRSVYEDGAREWARWGKDMPARLRQQTLRSSHTVFIPHGWADLNVILFSYCWVIVFVALLMFVFEV